MPICGLCKLNVEQLIDSHLVPKAAYKQIRSRTPLYKPSPFRIDHASMSYHRTDNQITYKFLCAECEDRFSSNGEKIIGTLWATHKGFPLLEKLTEQSKVIQFEGGPWTYNDSFLDEKERNGIIYFCISILWRANNWPKNVGGYQRVLGTKYEAIFREYLLNGTPLENIYFFLFLNNDGENSALFSLPQRYRNDGISMHSFKMLGIRFEIIIGSQKTEMSNLFKLSNTKSNILLRPENFGSSKWFDDLAAQVQAIKNKRQK